MLLCLVGFVLLLMVVAGMAAGKRKVTAKQKKGGSSSRASEIEEEEEDVEQDRAANWVQNMPGRGFKSERQVDMPSINIERFGLQHIEQRGISSWLEPLKGYNKDCVIKFYQNMVVGKNQIDIKSKVGKVTVEVNPEVIAKYLDYARPPPETITYPDVVMLDLNEVLHANLYPRGSDHKPGRKGAELIHAFMSPNHVIDIARFIFFQIINFQADNQDSSRMPFPCMITALCKNQGVTGQMYTSLEFGKPGPLDISSWNKSKSKSHKSSKKEKGKLAELTEMPGPKEKQDSWIKKIFCMVVWLVKENKKIKRERKVDRKVIARQAHKVDWLVQQCPSAREYVAPPEVESEDSDEVEEEEELDPGMFRGEDIEMVFGPGASGGQENRSEKDVSKAPNNPRRNAEAFEYVWHIRILPGISNEAIKACKEGFEALEGQKKEENSQNQPEKLEASY
ncbi:hypothetical protein RHSIM_Rhsim05G0183400 [Rhododendron simsii]|uniref:Putative plant transposon protein domain-containing protein n=1 Tax=Rhododendron simsii TaxID=118357 RepID=A0A834GYI5_RHOSS|nr:hypothetical protein RHSIM_Rhsim05G0183400 [Rhododendron simsii]